MNTTAKIRDLGAALMVAYKDHDRPRIRSVRVTGSTVEATDGHMAIIIKKGVPDKGSTVVIPRDFAEQVYVVGNRTRAEEFSIIESMHGESGSLVVATIKDSLGTESTSLSFTRGFAQSEFPDIKAVVPSDERLAEANVVRLDGRLLSRAITAMKKAGHKNIDIYVQQDPLTPATLSGGDGAAMLFIMPVRR